MTSLTPGSRFRGTARTPFRTMSSQTEWRRSAAANAGGDAMHAFAEPPLSPTPVGAAAPSAPPDQRRVVIRLRDGETILVGGTPPTRTRSCSPRKRSRSWRCERASGRCWAIASSIRTRSSRSTSSAGPSRCFGAQHLSGHQFWPRLPIAMAWCASSCAVRPAPGLSGSFALLFVLVVSGSLARVAYLDYEAGRDARLNATQDARFSATAAAEQLDTTSRC